jgi:hypothetical protein
MLQNIFYLVHTTQSAMNQRRIRLLDGVNREFLGSQKQARFRCVSAISADGLFLLLTRPMSAGHYQFISIQTPCDAKDETRRRLARSHAVKQALANKRRIERESRDNFRVTTCQEPPKKLVGKKIRTTSLAGPLFSPSAGVFDPFQSLAVDSWRLQTLLGNCELMTNS